MTKLLQTKTNINTKKSEGQNPDSDSRFYTFMCVICLLFIKYVIIKTC